MTGINIKDNQTLKFLFGVGLIEFTGVWNDIGRVFQWKHAPELKNFLTEELDVFVHDPEPEDEDDRFWWSQRHWTYACINRPNFPIRRPMHLVYHEWGTPYCEVNEENEIIKTWDGPISNIEVAFRNFNDMSAFWNVYCDKLSGDICLNSHIQPFPASISFHGKELVEEIKDILKMHTYAIPE